MKKRFFVFMLAAAMCGVSTVCQAARVRVNIEDPFGDYPVHRTPTLLPEVYIDGYTLWFEDISENYQLQIVQNDVVVYSTSVFSGTSSVVLPSALSGSYEIRLISDTHYYIGYIEL